MNLLKSHKWIVQTVAFVLIVLTSIGLYFAPRADTDTLIWVLLSLAAVGNLLAVMV